MKRCLENANKFTVTVTAILTISLTLAYHLAFEHWAYTFLMVLVSAVIAIHMLSPFTPPRYKRSFDLVALAAMVVLVALGANSHSDFLR